MDRQEIEKKIWAVVADVLCEDECDLEDVDTSTPFNTLGADSLDQLAIEVDVEEAFGIVLPDDKVGMMQSVKVLADFVEKALAEN